MDDIYNNIDDYDPTGKRKIILIAFDEIKPQLKNYLLDSGNVQVNHILTVYSCHVTHAFHSESPTYSFLNVRKRLAQSRH